MKYNDNKKIISQKLDLVNQAKTAAEILDEVLGVSFTMPIWVEDKLNNIVNIYSEKEMSQEEFTQLRADLKSIGLEKLVPSAISKILDMKND